jgi:dipeptidyl aminopeptidase/acylaminoacyl peptidase
VDVKVTYDNANLFVGDELSVKVDITLNKDTNVQWAIVDLGVPPGFDVLSEDLDALVSQSSQLVTKVRRYELTGSQIILYLENLDYKISFGYRLRAKFPLKAQVPPSSVYDYYNPEVSGTQPPTIVSVVTKDQALPVEPSSQPQAPSQAQPPASSQGDIPAGVVAFDYNTTVSLVNTDGSGLRQLSPKDWRCYTPAWSPDGKTIVVACQHGILDDHRLYTLDRNTGAMRQLTQDSAFSPAWSPDGKRIAFQSAVTAPNEIMVLELATGLVSQLTRRSGFNAYPDWSPDGKTLAFVSGQKTDTQIWIMDADGKNQRPILATQGETLKASWSPDGKYLLYTTVSGGMQRVSVDGKHNSVLPKGLFGTYSPDGQWIVSTSTLSEGDGLVIMNAEGEIVRRIPTENMPTAPAWAPR